MLHEGPPDGVISILGRRKRGVRRVDAICPGRHSVGDIRGVWWRNDVGVRARMRPLGIRRVVCLLLVMHVERGGGDDGVQRVRSSGSAR
jgi:hypothetical protein